MTGARRMMWRCGCFVLAFAGSLSLGASTDEAALLDLWKQQTATPEQHEALEKACQAFAAAHPADALLPLVHDIEAWHRLREGNRSEAIRLMEPYLSAPVGPVTEGARLVALGWLTRLDREQVASALQAYYRQEIAYPKSLDALMAKGKAPLEVRFPATDRFGKPWAYALTGFAKVAGFADQKYSLQSAALGDTSDFKTALALPYAARLTATAVQVLANPGNTVAVKFTLGNSGRSAVVGVGQTSGDLHLAFVGTQILVVCDYTHWKLLPKP